MNNMSMKEVFIGRQPVFDRDLNVYGYELLYRRDDINASGIIDDDRATSQVIVNTCLEFGLDRLVGTAPAFINVTPGLLLDHKNLPFSQEQVGLELPEDIALDDHLMDAVRALAEQGCTIVLDNFRYHEKLIPLLKLANIVKIDVRVVDDTRIRDYVEQLRPHKVKLLATKVETHEELASCMAMGFQYFQGYFLAKPKVVRTQGVAPSRLAVLRLLAALQDPDTRIGQIEELVSQDVSLSYKLLRYINSAFFALPKKIESIRRAATYLGIEPVKRWVRLVAMSGVVDQPQELLMTALNRAKMCELLGQAAGQGDMDAYFSVGLFSTLEALVEMPMAKVLEQLPLSDELTSALLRREGELGRALECILAHEKGDWQNVSFADLPPQSINEAFVQAVTWSRDASSGLMAG